MNNLVRKNLAGNAKKNAQLAQHQGISRQPLGLRIYNRYQN
jgi:hypothetical protein